MSITRNGEITLSSVLLFCRYPQAFFPQLSIIALRVAGETAVPNRIERDFSAEKPNSKWLTECEGVFGRLKNEMFYNTDWTGISLSEFIDMLNNYLVWYNETRIKKSLGYMSPMEYR